MFPDMFPEMEDISLDELLRRLEELRGPDGPDAEPNHSLG